MRADLDVFFFAQLKSRTNTQTERLFIQNLCVNDENTQKRHTKEYRRKKMKVKAKLYAYTFVSHGTEQQNRCATQRGTTNGTR